MANINLREIIRKAVSQGWTVEKCKNNHYKFCPPDKTQEVVVTSHTPSDYRAYSNFLSRMKRSGFKEKDTVAA